MQQIDSYMGFIANLLRDCYEVILKYFHFHRGEWYGFYILEITNYSSAKWRMLEIIFTIEI